MKNAPVPTPAFGRVRPWSRTVRAAHGAAFTGLLAVWFWLLIEPDPVPETFLETATPFEFDLEFVHFVLAKLTHFSAYAVLALIGGFLPRTPWGQVRIWGGLMLHGIASEVGQVIGSRYFDTGRHGCVRDALIDGAGVVAGAVVVRWLRRKWPARH